MVEKMEDQQTGQYLRRRNRATRVILKCALIAGCVLIVWWSAYVVESMRHPVFKPIIREHVPASGPPVGGPPDGTDLCYAIGRGLLYEFTISEASLRKWKKEWDLVEIGPEPVRIRRYTWYVDPTSPTSAAIISNGLVIRLTEEEKKFWDQVPVYAYDRDKQRVYYSNP